MNPLPLLAISDGAAGNRRQAAALAACIGGTTELIELQPHAPWRWLAPRRLPAARHAFGEAFARRLRGPLPALAIGCGRQAALATRLLRARGCRVVQILDPRLDPRHWDLVVAPQHDRLCGGNVLATLGSLNPVDDAWLARGRADWPQFAALPSPRIAVLLGGPTASMPFTPRDFEALAAIVRDWLDADGGSLLLTSSARTPAWLRSAAGAAFGGLPGLQWHGAADGPNPYPGLLGWAERIVVSPDSSNLLSEACAVGVPVLSPLPAGAGARLTRLHAGLRAAGQLRPLQARFEPWACPPLRETAAVAAEVRRRLLDRA